MHLDASICTCTINKNLFTRTLFTSNFIRLAINANFVLENKLLLIEYLLRKK